MSVYETPLFEVLALACKDLLRQSAKGPPPEHRTMFPPELVGLINSAHYAFVEGIATHISNLDDSKTVEEVAVLLGVPRDKFLFAQAFQKAMEEGREHGA